VVLKIKKTKNLLFFEAGKGQCITG